MSQGKQSPGRSAAPGKRPLVVRMERILESRKDESFLLPGCAAGSCLSGRGTGPCRPGDSQTAWQVADLPDLRSAGRPGTCGWLLSEASHF